LFFRAVPRQNSGRPQNHELTTILPIVDLVKLPAMLSLLLFWIGALIRLFRSRGNLVLENLMLRQQLAVLKRRHPRPSLGPFDKLFWVIARRVIARRV